MIPAWTSSEPSLHPVRPCRATLPTILDTPAKRMNVRHLPIPHISLHAPHPTTFHLPHIPLPNLMRRDTKPAKFKIQCTSGPMRRTHPVLSTCTFRRRGTIQQHDIFVCLDGVNAPRLLALSREALCSQAKYWGGNALVDEAWSYTIRPYKSSRRSSFKVSITYVGVVAQCDRPDPHLPVAIEEAEGIPGLMTVLSRE